MTFDFYKATLFSVLLTFININDVKFSGVVVEGIFSCLGGLGFPLPALAAMQWAGAQISAACWDVRKSMSGLSASFFWPTSHCQSGASQCPVNSARKISTSSHYSKSKKRQIRREKQKVKCTQTSDKDLDKVCKVSPDVPNDAHSPSNLVNNTLKAEDAELSDSLTYQSGCDTENLDDGNSGVAAGVENLSFHADSISSTLVPTEGSIVTKNLADVSLGTDSNMNLMTNLVCALKMMMMGR